MTQPPAPPSPADAPPASPSAAAAGAVGSDQHNNGGNGQQFDPNAPSISQSHMNHLLAEQKRELNKKYGDYDDLRERAAKFDTLVGTTRTAEEQAADLTTKLASADRAQSDLQLTVQRQQLAARAGIHPDLWDMIGGADEASINTNIERLKAHTAPAAPSAGDDKQQQRRGRAPGQGRPGAGGGDNAGPNGSIAAGRELFQSRQPKKG